MNKKIISVFICMMVLTSLLTGCGKLPSEENLQVGGVSSLDSRHSNALSSLWLQEKVAGYTYLYDAVNDGDPLLLVATPKETAEGYKGLLSVDSFQFNSSTNRYERCTDIFFGDLAYDKTSPKSKYFLDKDGYLYYAAVNSDGENGVTIKKIIKGDKGYVGEYVNDKKMAELTLSNGFSNDTYTAVQWSESLPESGLYLNNKRDHAAPDRKICVKAKVHFYNDDEIAKAQNCINPNPSSNVKKTIAVLDNTVSFPSRIAQFHHGCSMVLLPDGVVNEFYDGKDVYLTFDRQEVKWGDKKSLPIGEPRLTKFNF